MGSERFLTINTVIRKYQIETTRADHLLADETNLHDADRVRLFSQHVRRGFPEAKITWALSWQALHDQSERYQNIRYAIGEQRERFGDTITFVPGGYFANVYNHRDQVNRDISEALAEISRLYGGYRPRSLICGFLSADNIRYAREHEGIIAIQGNIWSQYSIDAQDADGSIAYPYYPSTEHFCKPAQSDQDRIDCLNFDGWTVDLVSARMFGDYEKDGLPYSSRMGVGPLETIHALGIDRGLQEMQHTTRAHFGEENLARNPLAWITNTYELGESTKDLDRSNGRSDHLEGFSTWLMWIRNTWPDVHCTTIEEVADYIRARHLDNQQLRYTLSQSGSGIGSSFAGQKVTWYMNSKFRLGIVEQDQERRVFDFADYTQSYREPSELGTRDWTLYGEINQKQVRPQDRPCRLRDFAHPHILREVGEYD